MAAAEQGVTFTVTADYEQGDNVGIYTITADGVKETKNYVVTYERGELNVVKRSVTVTINDNTGSTYGNPFNALTAYVSHGTLYAPDGEWSDVVSLTVCDSTPTSFRVAIIPYTFEHTNFCRIEPGSVVNLEFDIIGKYIARLMQNYMKS